MSIPKFTFWSLCPVEGYLEDGVYTWRFQLAFCATFPDGVSFDGIVTVKDRSDGRVEILPPSGLPAGRIFPQEQFAAQVAEYYREHDPRRIAKTRQPATGEY